MYKSKEAPVYDTEEMWEDGTHEVKIKANYTTLWYMVAITIITIVSVYWYYIQKVNSQNIEMKKDILKLKATKSEVDILFTKIDNEKKKIDDIDELNLNLKKQRYWAVQNLACLKTQVQARVEHEPIPECWTWTEQ